MFRAEPARGPLWYAKYRLPDGRQIQKKLGPAWSGRGRPATGYFRKRWVDDRLRDVLHEARRGTTAGKCGPARRSRIRRAEWLRSAEVDRQRKLSTLEGYRASVRSQLLPAFGLLPAEPVTTDAIERWLCSLSGAASRRTKAVVLLHGTSN